MCGFIACSRRHIYDRNFESYFVKYRARSEFLDRKYIFRGKISVGCGADSWDSGRTLRRTGPEGQLGRIFFGTCRLDHKSWWFSDMDEDAGMEESYPGGMEGILWGYLWAGERRIWPGICKSGLLCPVFRKGVWTAFIFSGKWGLSLLFRFDDGEQGSRADSLGSLYGDLYHVCLWCAGAKLTEVRGYPKRHLLVCQRLQWRDDFLADAWAVWTGFFPYQIHYYVGRSDRLKIFISFWRICFGYGVKDGRIFERHESGEDRSHCRYLCWRVSARLWSESDFSCG